MADVDDPYYKQLLEKNKTWVEKELKTDPLYFDKLQAKQSPRIFWIECADSLVTPETLLAARPGEVFTYRNVANVCVHTGMAFLGAMDYAVTHLHVDQVIVCGHYGCGGIKAAMSEPKHGPVDNWLCHIKDVYRYHKQELDALHSEEERFQRLVELNVHEQVLNAAGSSIVQAAWQTGRKLSIHGWVFDIRTGRVVDLGCTLSRRSVLEKGQKTTP